MISAQLVKELREVTGAGMMDCKKALVETNGNMEEAVKWLREKGIMKAQKKENRIAAEGVCKFVLEGNKIVVFEVNSETDFVAKNEKFQAIVNEIGEGILHSNAKNDLEALEVVTPNGTIKDLLINATATIGEKISLRRVNVLEKTDTQIFGAYSHMNGKIVAVVLLDGDKADVAKDIAMHIAAMNPKYLDESKVDPVFLANEKEIAKAETLNDGKQKPENIVEKIVAGKVAKILKGICLVDQMFIKNEDITVGQYAKDNKCNIVTYIRLEVGEGIEKKKDDFVSEVMSAVNK